MYDAIVAYIRVFGPGSWSDANGVDINNMSPTMVATWEHYILSHADVCILIYLTYSELTAF